MRPDPLHPLAWFRRVAVDRYATFHGRARRTEYWWYTTVYAVIYLILVALDHALGTQSGAYGNGQGWLSGLFALVLLIPSLAVLVRRLHDTDKSAWWLLVLLVPILGWIALFIFTLQPGDVGSNGFGPDPKPLLEDRGLDV